MSTSREVALRSPTRASSKMTHRPQPTNDEIRRYVEHSLVGADLEKITLQMVDSHMCSHFPGINLELKRDFIRETIETTKNSLPTIAQMKKLVKFLEENPEIATGADQANNGGRNLLTTRKWDGIANELNLVGRKYRSAASWAKFWVVLRSHLNHFIFVKQSAPGSRVGIPQPYPRVMMKEMIIILKGPGSEDLIVDPTDDEIRACVEQILHDRGNLEKLFRTTVYKDMHKNHREFAQKKNFITATIKSIVNLEPTVAQMEELLTFLKENPDIATGIDQANNDHQKTLQMTQKWEALANELNLMGGAHKSGEFWAEYWDVFRSHLKDVIADRKSAPGFRGGVRQPHARVIMEQMIILLGGPGIEFPPSPSNDEIREYVDQIMYDANLEKITLRTVYKKVCRRYPDFDLAHKLTFIENTFKSIINSQPSIAQMERLVKFLKENPEIAKGTSQANYALGNLPMTQKWEGLANELNSIGGENKTAESWAKYWYALRGHLKLIILYRKTAPGSRGGIVRLHPRAVMERIIILLGGPGNEETPPPASSNDAIRKCVKQLCSNLAEKWKESMYRLVCGHFLYSDLAHKKTFIKATIKSITQRLLASRRTFKFEDLRQESSGDVLQSEEELTTQAGTSSAASRRAARLTRRTKARAIRTNTDVKLVVVKQIPVTP